MTPALFKALCAELMDENPFAIRAVLKLLKVEFTDAVPTLAVTLEERPRLLVNLGFVREWCKTEDEVKGLICHEFLHVLLRHTERFQQLDPAQNIALDAVINAIIHRQLGPRCSSLMSRYYAGAKGIDRLLRPQTDSSEASCHYRLKPAENQLRRAWTSLYEGKLVADDILDLAADFREQLKAAAVSLLGGHGEDRAALDLDQPLPPALEEALDRVAGSIDGGGIWREARGRGRLTDLLVSQDQAVANVELVHWRRTTLAVLRKHLLPDPHGAREGVEPHHYFLPVLSPTDRRATLRALWSPFLPEAAWPASRPRPGASAQVYLDASGSMHAEMPLIIALLARLSSHIRQPFWAFSDVVAPARIEGGRLVTHSTGGTRLGCVLQHLVQTRPAAAVVVTDGYIEDLPPALVAATRATRLHVLLTHKSSATRLETAGIACTRLAAVPG